MNETIGDRLRQARINAGMTISHLSDIVHCDISTICNYENNKTNPSLHIIADIAKTLNVSIDYLVFGEVINRCANNIAK